MVRRRGFPDALEDHEAQIDECRADGWPMPPPKSRKGNAKKCCVRTPICLKCGSSENLVACVCITCLRKLGDKIMEEEEE